MIKKVNFSFVDCDFKQCCTVFIMYFNTPPPIANQRWELTVNTGKYGVNNFHVHWPDIKQ